MHAARDIFGGLHRIARQVCSYLFLCRGGTVTAGVNVSRPTCYVGVDRVACHGRRERNCWPEDAGPKLACSSWIVMSWLSRWVLGLFATPIGVMILAAADSTLFFSLPF